MAIFYHPNKFGCCPNFEILICIITIPTVRDGVTIPPPLLPPCNSRGGINPPPLLLKGGTKGGLCAFPYHPNEFGCCPNSRRRRLVRLRRIYRAPYLVHGLAGNSPQRPAPTRVIPHLLVHLWRNAEFSLVGQDPCDPDLFIFQKGLNPYEVGYCPFIYVKKSRPYADIFARNETSSPKYSRKLASFRKPR